ncbi:ABC transporter ATP-binding protein [Haematospirillum jordaniae]|uniref:Phosphonate ABC transporter ATP-binding protein n=1 Tax=Haematospirillum jordaniae TaxID=1549855 RepID=A0A143DGS4_9PROT|nr:ABC transporter ATP-binding protein [Haematospirillum jordaniae]AMW35915.1 phosphonate ABC transporter ATP-binding protein [Haematospirillum jordaniae]NKD45932.1 ABC transporter ATP-binding protein [Haematospirillum jordaniae]NKD58010.1 ABC transporter ATP-binding protein [Haematospirillum jordaniae]NKD60058.1 ABC transporter ATP-binding protein [Haematospirillum jordaniae]NKD68007.1 ABC transporter ATP-binding protein [Haematospirillum jordaniae]
MIRLENVGKTYRTSEMETRALTNVSLDIDGGEFVSIMGPSGSGKSTLLSILGLLDTPSEGTIQFGNTTVSEERDSLLTELRRKHIGFVFQAFNLIPHLSIERNVELGLVYRGVGKAERRKRSLDVLKSVGLEARAKHYPAQLSGGQQQRAAIARALVGDPTIILADEPTGNLDSQNGEQILDMLQGIVASGKTVVMVTHDERQAQRAHRTISMKDGRIVL